VGHGYAVKRIVVSPGKRLSLQRHAHRSEHWVIASGLAQVTRADQISSVAAGDHVEIGVGQVHRIENTGRQELIVIEVQHGARLEEDDIERLEDDYGRNQDR
jgi:mannose-6-phosphate isomerase-like protein (cupin superfamily)